MNNLALNKAKRDARKALELLKSANMKLDEMFLKCQNAVNKKAA